MSEQNEQPNESETMFSRSGQSNPFGKCTEQVKTWLPPVIKEKFLALAIIKAGGESEYLRQIVMEKVCGEFELMRLRNSRDG
jgi:hypothetical protein